MPKRATSDNANKEFPKTNNSKNIEEKYCSNNVLLAGYSLGSTLKWIALWEYDGLPFRVSKLPKLDVLYIFFQNTTWSNVQTKTTSKLTEYFSRRIKARSSDLPAASLIKKTWKFQGSWNKRLNFWIPGTGT